MDAFREQQEILARELPKSRADAGGTPRGPHAILPTIEGFALVVRRCIDHLKEIGERYKTNNETQGDYRDVLEVARALGIEV